MNNNIQLIGEFQTQNGKHINYTCIKQTWHIAYVELLNYAQLNNLKLVKITTQAI